MTVVAGNNEQPTATGIPAAEAAGNPPPSPAPAVGTSPPAPTGSEAGEGGPPAPAPVKEDWRDRRIAQLTAKLAEARAVPAPVPAPASAPGTVPAPNVPAAGTAEFQRAVAQAAAQQAEITTFNASCDAVAADGRTRFGTAEFNSKIGSLMQLVDRSDPSSLMAYNSFLMAAMEAGDAAQVIMDLGTDLNEASRVMAMSPVKMAAELTRKVVTAKAARGDGDAPPPPRPLAATISNRGQQHTQISPSDPDRAQNLKVDDWMTRREAEVEARRRQKAGLPVA